MCFPSKRLKQLRKGERLTQAELGKLLGLSKQTISCYENETRLPDAVTLTRIADVFATSVDYLLGRTDRRSFVDQASGYPFVAELPSSYQELPPEAKRKIEEYIELLVLKYIAEKK